jgi:nucleotide-binding universal stress UspA family protein
MKKILCPTDFSETADKAVLYAAKMAQKTGAGLILFHVQSIWNTIPSNLLWGKFITMKAVKEHLDELSLEVSRVYKISCYGEVQTTSLSVCRIIEDTGNHYDLIVMGTDGPDTIYQFFFGSRTFQVARQVKVPVLLLPDGYEFQEIAHVVYASDYLHDPHVPLDQLIQWAESMKAKITILQVMKQPLSKQEEDKLIDAQLTLKKLYAERISLDFAIIYSDNPIEGINSYTSHNECDALAVCARDYTLLEKLFHKSVIRNLSATTQNPLFVFHS